LGILVAIVLAGMVNADARRLSDRGARLSPGLWAILVFLVWPIVLPLYLLLRYTLWKAQIETARARAQELANAYASAAALELARQEALSASSPSPPPSQEESSSTAGSPPEEAPAIPASEHAPSSSGSEQASPLALAERGLSFGLPVIPDPRLGTAVVWCFLLLVVQFFLGFCAGFVLGAAGQKPEGSVLLVVAHTVTTVGMVVLAILLLGSGARRSLAWRRARPLHLLLAILVVPPMVVVSEEISVRATQGLDAIFELEGKAPAAYIKAFDEEFERLAREPWLVVLIVGCLLPGIGEEIFFRGLLGRGLVAHYGPVRGVLFTSALFGLMHVDPVQICYAATLGIVLHVAYLSSKSLGPSMAMHVTYNVVGFGRVKLGLAGALDPSGPDQPVPIPLLCAAIAAIFCLGYAFYRTRTWWALPDGTAWSPEYVTAEMPAARLGARARRTKAGMRTLLVGAGGYGLFGLTAAFLAADWTGLSGAAGSVRRGEECLERSDYRGAVVEFTEAIRQDPRNVTAYTLRGEAHRLLEELPLAIADYDRAIELRPENPMAHASRGAAHFAQGHAANALADCSEAIRLNPAFSWAYEVRGLILHNQGNYARAAADFTKATELDPTSASAFNSLAWQMATCPEQQYCNGKKAVEYATKACQLTGWREPEYVACLAAAQAECGRFDEAVKRQDQALKIAPAEEQTRYLLLRAAYQSRQALREEKGFPRPLEARPDDRIRGSRR
jgi:membrane protease YdiL (CAAX protease family)/tetratricopeptide (TPR) repeat protein